MTKKQAVDIFMKSHAKGTYDYWTVQEDWAFFTDTLCKHNMITQKQYDTWTTPFKYGKPVTFVGEGQ